jgi:hypothetical protein
MVFAYAIISREGDTHYLYTDKSRIVPAIADHLSGLDIRDYTSITDDITTFSTEGKKLWVSPMSSYAIYNAVSNKVR